MLLKRLAAARTGPGARPAAGPEGRGGSPTASARASRWRTARGSRAPTAPRPRQVGRLLAAMSRRPEARPTGARSRSPARRGRVAGRMNGTAADGRCRAKTGTLIGVSALSGLLQRRARPGRLLDPDELGRRRRRAQRPGQDGGADRPLPALTTAASLACDGGTRASAAPPSCSRAASEALLVEDGGPDLLGLGELRAGAVAGDHVVGALGDRAGHLAAGAPDQRGGLLAGQVAAGCR